MAANAGDTTPLPRRWPTALRIVGGLLGGAVAMALVVTLIRALLPLQWAPNETVFLFLLALGNVLAVSTAPTIGGAVARVLAGPGLWKNWLGVASLLTLLALLWLLDPLLPRYGWSGGAHGYWAQEGTTQPTPMHTLLGWGVFTVVLTGLGSLLLLLLVACFAHLGDRWAARRMAARAGRVP